MESNRVEKGPALEKSTTKALKAMRAMPHAFVASPTIPYEALDKAVHDQLVRELYPVHHLACSIQTIHKRQRGKLKHDFRNAARLL